jgi:hypothetical protein
MAPQPSRSSQRIGITTIWGWKELSTIKRGIKLHFSPIEEGTCVVRAVRQRQPTGKSYLYIGHHRIIKLAKAPSGWKAATGRRSIIPAPTFSLFSFQRNRCFNCHSFGILECTGPSYVGRHRREGQFRLISVHITPASYIRVSKFQENC